MKEKKAEKVADIPFLSPYLGVDFCWTADGSRFFYWVTSSFSDKPYQMEMEMYGGEVPLTQEYWARIRGNIYLNQIMRGDAKTGNVKNGTRRKFRNSRFYHQYSCVCRDL
mgnify:CR=1 FL=1